MSGFEMITLVHFDNINRLSNVCKLIISYNSNLYYKNENPIESSEHSIIRSKMVIRTGVNHLHEGDKSIDLRNDGIFGISYFVAPEKEASSDVS